MTSFLTRCRRTIQPRQMIESVITVQPSSETAAGPIFQIIKPIIFCSKWRSEYCSLIASFLWSKRTAAFFFRCRAAVSVFLFAWTLISRDADFTSHKQIAHHKIKKLCLYMANAEISVTSKNIVKGEREIFFLLLKRTFHILQTELKLYRYSIAPRMMGCYTVGVCQYTR